MVGLARPATVAMPMVDLAPPGENRRENHSLRIPGKQGSSSVPAGVGLAG